MNIDSFIDLERLCSSLSTILIFVDVGLVTSYDTEVIDRRGGL